VTHYYISYRKMSKYLNSTFSWKSIIPILLCNCCGIHIACTLLMSLLYRLNKIVTQSYVMVCFYVQWFEERGECSFCFYLWNSWSSLFILSLHRCLNYNGYVLRERLDDTHKLLYLKTLHLYFHKCSVLRNKSLNLYTGKAVYYGHSIKPKSVPFMSSCPLYRC
jgi:hypothetical protein